MHFLVEAASVVLFKAFFEIPNLLRDEAPNGTFSRQGQNLSIVSSFIHVMAGNVWGSLAPHKDNMFSTSNSEVVSMEAKKRTVLSFTKKYLNQPKLLTRYVRGVLIESK